MSLSQGPGRSSRPALITRFLQAHTRAMGQKFSQRVGLRSLKDGLPEDWSAPDSDIARKAEQAARALCDDFIIDHSHRTYCFAALLGAREGLK